MNYQYFRVKTRSKPSKKTEIKALIIVIVSLAIWYCVFITEHSGIVGKWFAQGLLYLVGKSVYILPLFLILIAIELFRTKKLKYSQSILYLLVFLFSSTFLGLLGLSKKIDYGGLFGLFLANFFVQLFGNTVAFIVIVTSILYLLSVVFNISWYNILEHVVKRLREDIHEWQRTRELVKKTKPQYQTKPQIVIPEPSIKEDTTFSVFQEQKPQIEKELTGEKPVQIQQEIEKYILPPMDFLSTSSQLDEEYKHEDLISKSALLEQTLSSFNVLAKVTNFSYGPAVTQFEVTPEPGVKVQSITTLANDIALALKAPNVRIIAPLPGKGTIGIEVPNPQTKIIGLREIITSDEFQKTKSLLTVALGKSTDNQPYVTDLIPMPHLLIAGATGSGKSVCIHSIITSILYKARPDEVKLLLIDPKRLELPIYNGLPHLYDPKVPPEKVEVLTVPKHISESLKALVGVMESRYEEFAKAGVRNIDGYNQLMERESGKKEFYILVIIDELADLILTLPREIEDSIQRLAQMSRAVGIHLVFATQRPSVDIITGVIKANFSARIAFQVLSKTDSRVILDTIGAEYLLGRGDMLFLPTGEPKPIRLQGSYVAEKEVEAIVKFIRKQKFLPDYNEISVKKGVHIEGKTERDKERDMKTEEDFEKALKFILERKRVSQDLLKALLGSSASGSNIQSLLETRGFIYKPGGTNRWHIHFDKIEEYLQNQTTKENAN